MKVRIGIGAGPLGAGSLLADVVEGIGTHGFDSLWLSEVLTSPVLDPTVALAWAGAQRPKLKLGTTMLLPGRNIVRLAKQLATLDALSGGRVLLVFVPGLAREPERGAIGLLPARRGAFIDEAIPVLRRLWAGETVTFHGEELSVEGVRISPLPVQQPLEMWLGGMAPASLERCGRLSDGWLPSLCTPAEAVAGRTTINEAADRAGRQIDPEHFGVSIGYSHAPLDDSAAAAIATRSRGNDIADLVPVGMAALRSMVEAFVDVGFSKFVVRPMAQPSDWNDELAQIAAAVGDLQT
jgi:probable F420-dependent oxidoreductase